MRNVFLAVALLILTVMIKDDKKTLLCHKWVQIGFKNHDALFQKIDKSTAKECLLDKDGNYIESAYNNTLNLNGQWFLNADQSKMEFVITTMNGKKLDLPTDTTRHFNIILLKLTKDTLIYGQEKYYGQKRIYGHDDLYFIRKD
jgi:hypothetical protein